MREDMFKVIVERPRWGSRHATKSKLRYDKCEGRSHVTGRRLAYEVGYTKSLNENLAPLRRYLHKQVGRRWNDVFSEICQQLDTGSTVKMHVREHLDDFVARKVRRDASGTLWSSCRRYGGEDKLVDCWAELYVDPDDGRIKKTRELCKKHGVLFIRSRWRQNRLPRGKSENRVRKLGALHWHVQLNGIWYLVQLSKVPTRKDGYSLSDHGFYAALQDHSWREHERWDVVMKRQLSHKQLKSAGLTNETKMMEGCYE